MPTLQEIDQSMGKIIRLHRLAAALTQEDLGRASGVKFQQVQKYETGANRISISRLFAMAEALQVSPAELITLVQEDIGKTDDTSEIDRLETLELLYDDNIRKLLFGVKSLENPEVRTAIAKLISELMNESKAQHMAEAANH